MKSQNQLARNKRRLAIFLLKQSARGEIVKLNLRNLLKDIYDETGEIFAKTDYGIVFQSFVIIDGDEVCSPQDPINGCGDGFDTNSGLCSSTHHKPAAPILIPASIEKYPSDFNPFPNNIHTVSSVLPTLKYIRGIKKKIIVKFRRDIGDPSIQKLWPKNIKFTRFIVKNVKNDKSNDGICDVIK